MAPSILPGSFRSVKSFKKWACGYLPREPLYLPTFFLSFPLPLPLNIFFLSLSFLLLPCLATLLLFIFFATLQVHFGWGAYAVPNALMHFYTSKLFWLLVLKRVVGLGFCRNASSFEFVRP